MTRVAAFLMSYLLVSPAFAADTPVLEATEAAVEQPVPGATAHVEAVAHGAEHASGGGTLPQFNVETFPTQVFWLFIMFTTIYVLVKTVIIPQIGGTMDQREEHITKELQAASELTEKARLGLADYENTIKTARQEAQATLGTAREQISKTFSEAEATQREQFQSVRDGAQTKINAQKDGVLSSMENEARTLAQSLASKLMNGAGNSKKAAA